MTYNSDKHHRRSIRIKGYDYSQDGLYYITVCAQNRICLFGKIDNGKMILNDVGKMLENEWLKLAERFKNIVLHEYVVMPNHCHVVAPNNGNTQIIGQPQGIAPTIGDIIGAFKSITTMEYIRGVKNGIWQPFNKKLWQRNYWDYWEHIIRNEKSYIQISEYIINNPENWKNDTLKTDY